MRLISHTHEISVVVQVNSSVQTNTQHQTDLEHIAGRSETCATCSYMPQDSCCVEHASCLLCIPFWLDDNYLFLWTSHFCLLSSYSGLPTSFRYHHLFTSTPANHGSRGTSARCEWIGIEQNNELFIQYSTCWDPTAVQTPHSPPRRCKCSHPKYDPGCRVENYPQNRKRQRIRSSTGSDVSIVVSR